MYRVVRYHSGTLPPIEPPIMNCLTGVKMNCFQLVSPNNNILVLYVKYPITEKITKGISSLLPPQPVRELGFY